MKLIFYMQISMKTCYKLKGMVKHFQSSQKSKFVMFLQYFKKKVRDEVDFLHADKHETFLQVDFSTLDIKVFSNVVLSLLMDMIKYSQSTQSNKFEISLEYLKKKLGMEFIFCMQKNIKVSTSWHYCFWWK